MRNFYFIVLILFMVILIPIKSFSSTLDRYLTSISVQNYNSGIDLVDCIYIINLKEREKRWKYIYKECTRLGLQINRVAAVNGWKLNNQDLEKCLEPSRSIKPGAIGCLLSHISILKNAQENNFDIVWILEDDACFVDNPYKVPELLRILYEHDPDWDIFYTDFKNVGNVNGSHAFLMQDASDNINEEIVRIRNRYHTTSLLVSKKGIEKILPYFMSRLIYAPIDVSIHHVPTIREYCSKSNIVTNSENSESDTENSTSHIGNREVILTPIRKFIKNIRKLFQ